MGRIEEARAAVKAALEQKPDLSLSYLKKTVPTKHPGGLDPYLDGLRKAGLPECRADFRFWLRLLNNSISGPVFDVRYW